MRLTRPDILWFGSLAAALVAADIVWGRIAPCIESRVLRGERLAVYNLAPLADCDVQVLGASRAFFNYRPELLGDRCFNAGMNGQGILMARVVFSLSRQKEGVVIIDPSFFDREIERLSSAHHLAGANAVVDSVLALAGPREALKLRSALYAHAGSVGPALANLGGRPLAWNRRVGTMPLNPSFRPEGDPDDQRQPLGWWWEQAHLLIDEIKARGLTPVVVISPCAKPEYRRFHDDVVARLGARARIVDARAWLPADAENFSDGVHLNPRGAAAFTRRLARELHLTP